jgi:hypothetical protein
MPDIKNTVGGPASPVEDIAMIQLMLKVIKDSKGTPYLGVNYSGVWNSDTKDAIVRFQKDHQLIAPPPPAAVKGVAPAKGAGADGGVKAAADAGAPAAAKIYDKQGEVAPKSATWQKLSRMLPATYADAMVYPGNKTVYLPGTAADAKTSATSIQTAPLLDILFAAKAADFVTQFFAQTKIVIKATNATTGLRRNFQSQMTVKSMAGPGESNHQWGRAADIGFGGLRWVGGDGTVHTENPWLDTKDASKKMVMPEAKRQEFWKLHEIVFTRVGLHPTTMAGDEAHVQSYADGTASMSRSLASLLNQTGAMKWEGFRSGIKGQPNQYKTDFGLGGLKVAAGSAKQIFGGNAVINAGDVANALKASKADLFKHALFKDFQFVKDQLKAQKVPPGKQPAAAFTGAKVTVTDIKQADIQLLIKAVKADWMKADQNWKSWVPVP